MADKIQTDYVKACVIGWPIAHSRSPLIHNTWIKQYGVSGAYDIREVMPDDLEHFLKHDLDALGYAGCNVTVPHKEHAFLLCDHVDDVARSVKAVNTIWKRDGQLYGSNTDVYGFMTHLNISAPDWNKEKRPVAVLGAGGAARAVLYGLLQDGASEIRLLNRTQERAKELAHSFETPAIHVGDWARREQDIAECGVLINTTSLGMTGKPVLDIQLDGLAEESTVIDIVYVPLETELLTQAKAKGHRVVNGLGMLLHQAVPGFKAWFGIEPKVTDALEAIVLEDLAKG